MFVTTSSSHTSSPSVTVYKVTPSNLSVESLLCVWEPVREYLLFLHSSSLTSSLPHLLSPSLPHLLPPTFFLPPFSLSTILLSTYTIHCVC